MTNPTKKRAQTSYGEVEYDTIQCAECTNDTVLNDITHLFVDSTPGLDFKTDPEEIDIHPVCSGCINEFYGYSGEILPHEDLCEFYIDNRSHADGGVDLAADDPETIERTHPTEHGDIEVDIAPCSRCDSEWTVDELRIVSVPIAMMTNIEKGNPSELHVTTDLYCPDCQELYLDAPDQAGPSFQEVVENGGVLQSDEAGDGEDTQPKSEKKTLVSDNVKVIAGWTLQGIILAALFSWLGLPTIGLCIFIFSVLFGVVSTEAYPESEDQ